eukprot:6759766-Prymnesium_polylepis.1
MLNAPGDRCSGHRSSTNARLPNAQAGQERSRPSPRRACRTPASGGRASPCKSAAADRSRRWAWQRMRRRRRLRNPP